MRKTLRCIICCLLCIVMASLSVMAAPPVPTMNMSWQGDYTNNKLVIKFRSPATYNQQVTAVMYRTSVVGTPTNADYLRVAEVTSRGGQEMTVSFTITNDLTDGQYYVRLQGNGVSAALCKEIQTVTIKTPSQADSLVASINSATANSSDPNYIGGFVEPNATALGITIPADATFKGKIMTALVSTRDNEYTNAQTGVKFTSLDQVRDAYNKSEIIVSLHETGTTASSFQTLVEANADLLQFDITEEDYVAEASYIYDMIVSNKATYEGTGIHSCSTLVDAIKKYRAIKEINDGTLSPVNTLRGVMEKYHNDLGVSADAWTKYTGFEDDAQRDSVLRQIYGKNFTVPSLAKAAFENGVTTVYNNGSGDPAGPSGPSGDSGNDGFGMGNDNGSLSEKPNPVPTVKGFFDCGETHWAYTYVKDLYDLGFISGYADGSFLPDNSVTREEFVKMVIGATGLYNENTECNFSDVPSNSWSYKYVASAYANGIVVGTSDSDFGAKSYITREDVCVISARILAKYGKQVDGENGFTDAASISDYAKDSVDALVELGIINGFEDGSFGAKKLLTRAQAAKIISLLRAAI